MLKLKFKKLTDTAIIPTQAHNGDMFDIYSDEDIIINSFESKIIHTNIAFDIPYGYRIKVFSRSSLPLKKQIIVSNAVGIIDTGYKNGIGLICHSLPATPCDEKTKIKNTFMLFNNPIEIHKSDKIAQFQLEKIVDFELEEVEELDMSNDRKGGFGSTGSN